MVEIFHFFGAPKVKMEKGEKTRGDSGKVKRRFKRERDREDVRVC